MTCAALMAGLGFDCHEIKNGVLRVNTRLGFCDGQLMGFYILPKGKGYVISDNCDTLFNLMNQGICLDNKRKWTPIRKIAINHGLVLTDNGEITTIKPCDDIGHLISSYLSVMFEINNFQRERMGISDDVVSFSNEVEIYLRQWKPSSPIILNPSFKGDSGILHDFDFEMDGKLIECISARSSNTASLIRKAADIGVSENTKAILAIIDDRKDMKKAKIESGILAKSGFVSVLTMSRLIANAGKVAITMQ